MRPAVSVKTPNPKIGILEYKSPVFRAQGKMSAQQIVDAAAVQESAFRLGISAE
jgi:hypothetical protein